MIVHRVSIFLCAFYFPSFVMLAQTGELLESIDPELSEEESVELDQIQWLQEHPLDLNLVDFQSLCSLPGVAPADAARVIEFRERNGRFLSEAQLLQIPDVQADAARWLQSFVIVRNNAGAKSERFRIEFRARTLQDIQLREGYRVGTYTGSPNKSYARLIVAALSKGEAGILVEKDAGETIPAGFLSGYLRVENLAFLDHVMVGDFRFEAGQGLVFWQGVGFGKGGNPAETGAKSPHGLVPHRSTDEFHFLRGVGVATSLTMNRVNVLLTGFYSSRRLPATIDTSGEITSFLETGMSRTESELSKQGGVRERLVGGNLLVSWVKGLSLGASGYRYELDHPIGTNSSIALRGPAGGVCGLNGRFEVEETEVTAEAAVGAGARPSWVIRGIHRTGRAGSLVVLYRSYSPEFPGFHSAGFGERADTRNEQGFYFGLTLRPIAGVMVSLYVDNFAFPQRTGTIPVPSHAHDVGLNLDTRLAANTDLSVRSTWSRSQTMAADADVAGRELRFLVDHDQHRFRMTFVHEANRNLRLKTRIEGTGIPGSRGVAAEKGMMLFQDIRYTSNAGLTIEARLAFFQTDSYNTRIYEFENDVRGVFSVPALYGTGKRWYLIARYEVLANAALSFKFSETQKEGVRTLGNGPGEIEGDKENRLTMQLDVRL